MSYNQQQPLSNTANADTSGLAGNNTHKTALGNTNTAAGYGDTTAGPGMTGAGTDMGYGTGSTGQTTGTGAVSSADNYNTNAGTRQTTEGVLGTQVPVQQGPYGAGTGNEVRQNDGIAKPIDWEAINTGKAGHSGAPYGLTGRAGQGGGVGAQNVDTAPLQDLGAGHDPTNTMGPSSGWQDGGAGGYAATGAGFGPGRHQNAPRHGAEAGALAGGAHGHGTGHTARDAAVGAAAGDVAGHEERNHAEQHDAEGKPSLMQKVKNILKPHHGNNTDPANMNTTDNTGSATNNASTGTGPAY